MQSDNSRQMNAFEVCIQIPHLTRGTIKGGGEDIPGILRSCRSPRQCCYDIQQQDAGVDPHFRSGAV